MKTLVIKFILPSSVEDDKYIRYILMDALFEFRAHRMQIGGIHGYVTKKYTWMNEKQQFEKMAQVSERCEQAELLRCGIETITLYPDDGRKF